MGRVQHLLALDFRFGDHHLRFFHRRLLEVLREVLGGGQRLLEQPLVPEQLVHALLELADLLARALQLAHRRLVVARDHAQERVDLLAVVRDLREQEHGLDDRRPAALATDDVPRRPRGWL